MKEFETEGAKALRDAEDRDHGPDDKLEIYYPPAQDETIFCTTGEREDFEEANAVALMADVIEDQGDYDSLVRFLVENYELKEVS